MPRKNTVQTRKVKLGL